MAKNVPAKDAAIAREKLPFHVQTLEKSYDIKVKKMKKRPTRKKGLSCKEKKKLKLFKLSKDEQK